MWWSAAADLSKASLPHTAGEIEKGLWSSKGRCVFLVKLKLIEGGALSFPSLLLSCSSRSTKTATVYSEFTGACEVSSYKSLMPVLSSPLLNWLPQIPLTALKGKGEYEGNRQAFCSVCCLKASPLTLSHYEVSQMLCFLSYMAFSGSWAETWAGLGTSRGLLFRFWEKKWLRKL